MTGGDTCILGNGLGYSDSGAVAIWLGWDSQIELNMDFDANFINQWKGINLSQSGMTWLRRPLSASRARWGIG